MEGGPTPMLICTPRGAALFGLLVLSACAGHASLVHPPGGATPEQFGDATQWPRFAVPEVPRVSIALPNPPEHAYQYGDRAFYLLGDGHYRMVSVGVDGGRALFNRLEWARENVEERCAFEAEVTEWRVVDGRDICVSTKRILDKDRRLATWDGEPFLRSEAAFVIVDGTLVTISYSAPEPQWFTDAPVRNALFSSIRIAPEVTDQR